jgi:hypothetical protein
VGGCLESLFSNLIKFNSNYNDNIYLIKVYFLTYAPKFILKQFPRIPITKRRKNKGHFLYFHPLKQEGCAEVST